MGAEKNRTVLFCIPDPFPLSFILGSAPRQLWQEGVTVFVPGYIIGECQQGEAQRLLQAWKQAIKDHDVSAAQAAKDALGEFFRRRSEERSTAAATFLNGVSSLGKSPSACPEIDAVPNQERKHEQRKRTRRPPRLDHWQQWR